MEFTDEPLEPFGTLLLDMAIPSQLTFKTPLVFRMIRELSKNECLPWTGSPRAELCCEEALANAIVHGNKMDPEKKVRVRLFANDERWGALVEDEGEGFSPEDVPDPDDPDFMFREAGRGILLMEGYLDELRYNRSQKGLLLIRRRQAEPDETEAEAALEGDLAAEASADAGPVTAANEDGVEVIEFLSARVDGDNIDAIREVLGQRAGACDFIVLDVSRLEYISSVGLGTLVAFYKQVRARNGHMMLAGVRPAVADILKSAHLERLFQTEPDRKSAVLAMKKLT